MNPEQSDVERQGLMRATASLIDDHIVEVCLYSRWSSFAACSWERMSMH